MPQADIDYFAVVVAAVVNMIIGAIWYAPPVFGRAWMRMTGIRPEDAQQGGSRALAFAVIPALVTAYVLAHFVDIWLGFVATTVTGSVLFERRPWSFWALTSGYYLVTLLVNGALLAVWA